jgi:hypothetical protein
MRTPKLTKVIRDNKIDEGVSRLKNIIARNKNTLENLPIKTIRTPAENRTARQCRDDILRDRLLLLALDEADEIDVDDGKGVE